MKRHPGGHTPTFLRPLKTVGNMALKTLEHSALSFKGRSCCITEFQVGPIFKASLARFYVYCGQLDEKFGCEKWG